MPNSNLSEQPEILEARYRLAARQIRAEARLRLLELRRERWEKRVATLGNLESAPQDLLRAGANETPDPKPPAVAPKPVETPPKRLEQATAIDTITGQFMVPSEIQGSIDLGLAAITPKNPPAEPTPAVKPATKGSDLELLPGVGEGLIWLLKSAGITCLKDLSQSDPAELAGRLGVVGELLDLKDWIAFARGAVKS